MKMRSSTHCLHLMVPCEAAGTLHLSQSVQIKETLTMSYINLSNRSNEI